MSWGEELFCPSSSAVHQVCRFSLSNSRCNCLFGIVPGFSLDIFLESARWAVAYLNHKSYLWMSHDDYSLSLQRLLVPSAELLF